MKIEIKLYKNFDADLLSMHLGGISVTNLMKIALKGYAHNNTPFFYIPKTRSFSLEGKKRFLHVSFNVSDKKSIDFLRKEIKYRQRSAFLKSLLRGCLIAPNLGIYYKNDFTINKESARIRAYNLDSINNVIEINYPDKSYENTKKKIKIEEITESSSYSLHLQNDSKSDKVKYNIYKSIKYDKEDKKDDEINDEDTVITDDDLVNDNGDYLFDQFLNIKG